MTEQIDLEQAIAIKARNGATAYAAGATADSLKLRKDDFYPTPPVAVKALLAAEQDMPHSIWEPCAGDGAIVRTLQDAGHAVVAHDLVDWGATGIETRIDFLMEHKAPEGVGAIITNPPYKLADEFIQHARYLVPRTCMLLRLAFLEGERRRRKIFSQGGLARVHVFSRRLPRMNRVGYEGKTVASKLAFAWFVWEREHKGKPEIDFLDWKDHT